MEKGCRITATLVCAVLAVTSAKAQDKPVMVGAMGHEGGWIHRVMDAIVETFKAGHVDAVSGPAAPGISTWELYETGWVVGPRETFWDIYLHFEYTMADLGAADEFSAFRSAYLGLDSDRRVLRIGLGWVSFSEGDINEPGECGDPETWTPRFGDKAWDCIESDGAQDFTVKMKVGHPGFGVAEMAGNIENRWVSEEDFLEHVDIIKDAGWVDGVSAFYLLTGIDNGRDVTFELYEPGNDEPIKTASGSDAVPGAKVTEAEDDERGVYNTCGGTVSACPMFYDPKILEGRESLRSLIARYRDGPGWPGLPSP